MTVDLSPNEANRRKATAADTERCPTCEGLPYVKRGGLSKLCETCIGAGRCTREDAAAAMLVALDKAPSFAEEFAESAQALGVAMGKTLNQVVGALAPIVEVVHDSIIVTAQALNSPEAMKALTEAAGLVECPACSGSRSDGNASWENPYGEPCPVCGALGNVTEAEAAKHMLEAPEIWVGVDVAISEQPSQHADCRCKISPVTIGDRGLIGIPKQVESVEALQELFGEWAPDIENVHIDPGVPCPACDGKGEGEQNSAPWDGPPYPCRLCDGFGAVSKGQAARAMLEAPDRPEPTTADDYRETLKPHGGQRSGKTARFNQGKP